MLSRILMSIFSRIYCSIESMPDCPVKWNPIVYVELFFAACMLPVAESNLRAVVSSRVSATDATTVKAGSCHADVSAGISQLFYCKSEKKRENIRLDWTSAELQWIPCKLLRPNPELDELIRSLPWTSPRASRFQRLSHINVQEMLACVHELRRRLSGEHDKRMVFCLDSRVVVGAIA